MALVRNVSEIRPSTLRPHVEGWWRRRRQRRVMLFSVQQRMGRRHAKHLCRGRRVEVGRHLVLLPLEDLISLLYLLPILGPPILEPDLHLQSRSRAILVLYHYQIRFLDITFRCKET